MKNTPSKDNNTGSLLIVIFFLLAVISFFYLLLWAYHNDNLKAGIISITFLLMLFFGFVIARENIFNEKSTWGQSCFWFTVGYFAYMTLTFFQTGRAVFSFPQNELFASISGSLPLWWEFYTGAIGIPLGEELFWLFGLPIILFFVLDKIGKANKLDKQPWFRYFELFVVILIGGLTFAIFHIGKMFIAFIISAIIFRSINTIFVWGEERENILPFVAVVTSFAIGTHQGNNWGQVGFFKGLNTLISVDDMVLRIFGIIIVAFYFIIFASAIGYLVEYFSSNKKGAEL